MPKMTAPIVIFSTTRRAFSQFSHSATAGMPSAGAADMSWVDFAVDNDVDLLAVSFVRSAADLVPVNERIRERGSDIPLIAKIEKPQALNETEAIIDEVKKAHA